MNRTLQLVVGFVALVVVATACEYREVDGVGTRTFDEEFVPQDDIDRFDGCALTAAGQWRVDGEITNNTDEMASYAITIAFFDGDTRLEERSLWIRDLHPDESAEMNRGWWINGSDQVTSCEVLTIDRFTTPIVG